MWPLTPGTAPELLPAAPALYCLLLQYYTELGMPAQARMLIEQAEQQGVSSAAAGMLGSLRGAVGGTVGSLVSRMQQQGSLR
jgi:hypothetical protein